MRDRRHGVDNLVDGVVIAAVVLLVGAAHVGVVREGADVAVGVALAVRQQAVVAELAVGAALAVVVDVAAEALTRPLHAHVGVAVAGGGALEHAGVGVRLGPHHAHDDVAVAVVHIARALVVLEAADVAVAADRPAGVVA